MHLRHIITVIAVAPLAVESIAAEALYRREIKTKGLEMSLQELRRTDKTSEVKSTLISGGSVDSSLTNLRAFYDIAKARGFRYFIKLSEQDGRPGVVTYLIGFSNDKDIDPVKYFSLSKPLPASEGHRLMAIEQFDAFFGGRE